MQAKSAHAAVLGSPANIIMVSQHAIDVEENQLYFARAHLGHAVEYSIASFRGMPRGRLLKGI